MERFMMQSSLFDVVTGKRPMTGDLWLDIAYTIADIVPPVLGVLYAYKSFKKSGRNARTLSGLMSALGYKEESPAKKRKKVDKSQNL
jgi:hypothetical protein